MTDIESATPAGDTVPDHSDPDRRATVAEIAAAKAWAESESEAWIDSPHAEDYSKAAHELALRILIHGRERLDEETVQNLTGDHDETPGELDRYFPEAVAADDGRLIVRMHCRRTCGGFDGGTVLVTVRDLDGGQTGLTLGELVVQALRHEDEDHDGVTS
jgi:hypothetical protein